MISEKTVAEFIELVKASQEDAKARLSGFSKIEQNELLDKMVLADTNGGVCLNFYLLVKKGEKAKVEDYGPLQARVLSAASACDPENKKEEAASKEKKSSSFKDASAAA